MGRGGLGHRGPVTKCKKFHKQKTPARAREEARKHRPGKAEAPKPRMEKFGVWMV